MSVSFFRPPPARRLRFRGNRGAPDSSIARTSAFPVPIVLGAMLALRRRGRYGLLYVDGDADFYQPEVNPLSGAASASGLVEPANCGSVPMQTICTKR